MVVLGHDNSVSNGDVVGHDFRWDKSPLRRVFVGAFRAEWRPVSNGEFAVFLKRSEEMVGMPKGWVVEDKKIKVSAEC